MSDNSLTEVSDEAGVPSVLIDQQLPSGGNERDFNQEDPSLMSIYRVVT